MKNQIVIIGCLLVCAGINNIVMAEQSIPTANNSMPSVTGNSVVEPATTVTPPPANAKAIVNTTASTSSVKGGEVKVWVNTKSKAFHCPGTKFYGKTKAGSYMTQTEAISAGNHAAEKGKSCI